MASDYEVVKPKLKDKELAASYGWAMSMLNSVPELKDLFKKAVKKQYTPERFTAEVKNTKWYQTTAEPARKYLVLRTTSPADYVSQTKAIMASLADQYSQMTGEVLKPGYPSLGKDGKVKDGTGVLAHIADLSIKLGWNEAQIKDQLYKSVDWTKKIEQSTLRGQASGYVDQFRQQAAAYGLQMSNQWYADRLEGVVLGNDSAEGVTDSLKTRAKQRYAQYADQLDAGMTISDIADNYKQSMAKVLEINPNTLDNFDPQIQSALDGNLDTDGKKVAKTVNDFEKQLRQDSRWQFTDNAKASIGNGTEKLLKSFGLAV